MNKLYMLACLIGSAIFLVSNASNPPDGHTGAPGESFCSNCHSPNGTTVLGTITVEGFPASITPGDTYTLTVVNRNTNDGAKKAGFQMTILGPTNTKAGDMSMPSANSALATSSGRQYFEHHPATAYPDSNVVKWTVLWKAPALAEGSTITWYANGVLANGNANDSGDKIVTGKGSGTVILSATEDPKSEKAIVFPNPGSDVINIQFPDQVHPDGMVYFYDMSGRRLTQSVLRAGIVNATSLSPGVYLLNISNGERSFFARWIKI